MQAGTQAMGRDPAGKRAMDCFLICDTLARGRPQRVLASVPCMSHGCGTYTGEAPKP